MSILRLPIKEFLQRARNNVLLDVRSPGEYGHAHMPGAISLPLFTDEERKLVGTTYKQQSREKAIKVGLDIFGPKMRKMVEEVEHIIQGSQSVPPSKSSDPAHPKPEIFVYCWRGGMRSGAVAWLLDLYGFKVNVLAGGYKTFRNHLLRFFEQPFRFNILGGFTGSGKTEVLQQLGKNGEAVIDLERIACHMGSAFGSYRMPPQPTQEMFENILGIELEAAGQEMPIWLEDESQRIGNLNIPHALWNTMRTSPILFLEIPFEPRLAHLVEEYRDCDPVSLIGPVERISKRLGPLETKNTIAFLEEGKLQEAFRILLQYYDKRYLKGLHNRENLLTLLTKINCETVTPENAKLLTKYQPA